MEKSHIPRLIGKTLELEKTLKNEGFRDGCAYAQKAACRELKLINMMAETFENYCDTVEVTADLLACTACGVGSPDCDTRDWIETNLSTLWRDEEKYVLGFIDGAREVLADVGSAEHRKEAAQNGKLENRVD